MKFLMDYTGTVSVNTQSVQRIYISQDYQPNVYLMALECEQDPSYTDPNTGNIHYDGIILKKFESDDHEKNMTAAKKYLAKLIDKLNSGGNL